MESAERSGLVNASADFVTVAAQADASAFEKVSYRGDGLAVVFRVAADGHDQIPEAVVVGARCFFQVLFHTLLGLRLPIANVMPRRQEGFIFWGIDGIDPKKVQFFCRISDTNCFDS